MNYSQLLEEMKKQKNEMSSTERMNAYLSGKEVDYIPYNLMDVELPIAEILGYTTLEMNQDSEVFLEILQYKKNVLGIEGVTIGMDLRTVGASLGSELSYPTRGIPHIKKHILMDYDDFYSLPNFNPYNNAILTPKLELAKRIKEQHPDIPISTSSNGPISVAQSIRPTELILRDMRRNPEKLKELIAFSLECCLEWVRAIVKEIGPVSYSFGDPISSATLLSKKQYLEFSLPYQQKLVDEIIKITGSKPTCHICGDTKKFWDDISSLNLSGFSADNIEDMSEVKEAFGDKMLIIGNIPPVEIMLLGSIDDVITSVKDCLLKASDSPNGYLLHTGCDVPLNTPVENLLAYIYAVKKYGSGAQIGRFPRGLQNLL